MKLTHKLTFAFVFISLVAIGLAAVFVGMTTFIGFNKYIVDQRLEQFVAVATTYYRANGSWAGVDATLRSEGLLPPFAGPGSAQPDPQPFALADANRAIIIEGGDYRRGEKVQKGVLAKGIGIEVGGVVVGTVLVTGEAPVRSPIETRYINSVFISLLVAALGGAGIALLLGFYSARTLTRPLSELTAATRQVARGRLGQQVAARSKDELGELVESFNQMNTDLAGAIQARRQMTADIAHDLRNPLTVIGGYLESMKDGTLKPTTERFATMQAEVSHLQLLVEDLRLLSLADSGEMKLQKQPVPVVDFLVNVRSLFLHQAEQRKIALEVEAAPGLPDLKIDPERMGQVLSNLLDNALRFTPGGGKIILSARQDGGRLMICVSDTGSGIPADVLPHIFERSYRGDPSRSGDGSGLGLAIARSIVELHGGEISALSTPGVGSEFRIALPAG